LQESACQWPLVRVKAKMLCWTWDRKCVLGPAYTKHYPSKHFSS